MKLLSYLCTKMKVHLIKKLTVQSFIKENAQSRTAFELWLSIIQYADWNVPKDIISTFGNADILGKSSNRVVFNIGGNKYRIICSYYFGKNMVHLFIKWIGTHAEYTKLCNKNEQYDIDIH